MGASVGDGVVAFARVVGTVRGDRSDFHIRRDLAEQFGQHGRVTDVAPSDLEGSDFQSLFIDADVDLAPYPAHKAAAIEAVASTGGQLTPPVMGAAAFLMAEFLAVPYSTVVIAAIVPAVLYYVAVFVQADLEAARMGILAVPRDQIPSRRKVMSGLHFLLGFGVLIYALFFMNWQPERAALLAAAMIVVTVLIFGYNGTRPGLRTLHRASPAPGTR